MLSKQFRLNLREEADFFLNCKKVHTPYFSLFYKFSESFQAAVVVSKKEILLATQRNAVKRKYRNSLQTLLEKLIKVKIKLVIVVHQKGANLSASEIVQQIENNVKKIRI